MHGIRGRIDLLERSAPQQALEHRLSAAEAALSSVATAHPGLSGYLKAASELRSGPTSIDGKSSRDVSDLDLVRYASVLAVRAPEASAAAEAAEHLSAQARLLDSAAVPDAAWARLEALEAAIASLSHRAHALKAGAAGVVEAYESIVDAGAAATLAAERALGGDSSLAPP